MPLFTTKPRKGNSGLQPWILRTLQRAKHKDNPQSVMSHWVRNNSLPHQSRTNHTILTLLHRYKWK